MRSWRYKQRRAHDAVTAHDYGWSIYGGSYDMQQHHMDLFYQIKHNYWWDSVCRYAYCFTNPLDAINKVYSNMKNIKVRRSIKYEMRK